MLKRVVLDRGGILTFSRSWSLTAMFLFSGWTNDSCPYDENMRRCRATGSWNRAYRIHHGTIPPYAENPKYLYVLVVIGASFDFPAQSHAVRWIQVPPVLEINPHPFAAYLSPSNVVLPYSPRPGMSGRRVPCYSFGCRCKA